MKIQLKLIEWLFLFDWYLSMWNILYLDGSIHTTIIYFHIKLNIIHRILVFNFSCQFYIDFSHFRIARYMIYVHLHAFIEIWCRFCVYMIRLSNGHICFSSFLSYYVYVHYNHCLLLSLFYMYFVWLGFSLIFILCAFYYPMFILCHFNTCEKYV